MAKKIADDAPGWIYYRIEIPVRYGKAARWVEYSMPTRENERTSAHKAALRKLERMATLNGVQVTSSHKRKTD